MILESSQAYPIRWVTITCGRCYGTGVLPADKEMFLNYLKAEYEYTQDFKHGHRARWGFDVYRQWKKTGEIQCVECCGAGKWSEPR